MIIHEGLSMAISNTKPFFFSTHFIVCIVNFVLFGVCILRVISDTLNKNCLEVIIQSKQHLQYSRIILNILLLHVLND